MKSENRSATQVMVNLPPLQAEVIDNLAKYVRCSVGDLLRGLAMQTLEGIENPIEQSLLLTLWNYVDRDSIPDVVREYAKAATVPREDCGSRLVLAEGSTAAGVVEPAAAELEVTVRLPHDAARFIQMGAVYDGISVEAFIAKAAVSAAEGAMSAAMGDCRDHTPDLEAAAGGLNECRSR